MCEGLLILFGTKHGVLQHWIVKYCCTAKLYRFASLGVHGVGAGAGMASLLLWSDLFSMILA